MRRSVPPERVHTAQQHRADMAATTRIQGVLIPPGTSAVILSYDGPVDVPALYHALGRMIADRDMLGLPVEALEQRTTDAAASEDEQARQAEAGAAAPLLVGQPRLYRCTPDRAQHEPATDSASAPKGNDETINDELGSPWDLGAFAIQPDAPARSADTETATPLEQLRAHGPATAAEFAEALGTTRQKAALELGALVETGAAVKDGKLYTATQ